MIINDQREALGLEPDDDSRDDQINSMQPADRLRLVCQWHLGDPTWAETFIDWARDCGYEVTAKTETPETKE